MGLLDDPEGSPSCSSARQMVVPGGQGQYAQVLQMNAIDPIPPPSQAAQASAIDRYKELQRASPELVANFESYFSAWQSARDRCDRPEFHTLVKMGTAILPLVIGMLLDGDNFTAVYLYNALEDDRQQSLIIDVNMDRKW
ncbi:hypothetical protein NLG97_g3869 [Lecanicillium saksenae]|uniref:Uncharacterized protein n=1 Tax=Lecanicillium saksenae TaxID=468837 RepID=A0ACC1QYK9_9HYPO|nr:hypothetical protein NLG97_g3869 [Lecanicillium saksenae]